MAPTWESRFEALHPLTVLGPGYHRGVAEALRDARLFADRGELEAAEHYLLVAEYRAGAIAFDEFGHLDPFMNQRRPQ